MDDHRDTARRRPDLPMWRQAVNGIGFVVAMAIAVTILGVVLSWLATIVL